MPTLDAKSLGNRESWEALSVKLPGFERNAMLQATQLAPTWLHFGAGNIFRGFIARIMQDLLNQGRVSTGIIAADSFDYEMIEKIYRPYDNLTMMADLAPTGRIGFEIIGSIADAICADTGNKEELSRLTQIACSPSLQLISFTVTEKGYALRNMSGEYLSIVTQDMSQGPDHAKHLISVVCSLILSRYLAGAAPLALSSMDNCSHNGEKLRSSLLEVAGAWIDNGYADEGFFSYLSDERKISFPWSMIDKITPRPAEEVEKRLNALGISDMSAITTSRGTYIAPFVNAEIPQYLVLEDAFPNGRPPFEAAGVYMTDRDTVNRTERMKVTTCLNPLHTSLAVFGCLLGYTRISDEMKDPELSLLVRKIGYDEGLPVVTDPKIMDPREFLREVIEERFPNPFIPDMPQRIATDTSLKIPIRFGETIKSYIQSPTLEVTDLTFIPLAIAGWLRYLLGIDDLGKSMEVSPDPQLSSLKEQLSGVRLGDPQSRGNRLILILSNESLFGTDLVACGLSRKIDEMFGKMLEGEGSVRRTLQAYLNDAP